MTRNIYYAAGVVGGPALVRLYHRLATQFSSWDEFSVWYYACLENPGLCKEGLGDTFAVGGTTPNMSTRSMWADGFAEVTTAEGVGVYFKDPVWTYLSDVTAQALEKWGNAEINFTPAQKAAIEKDSSLYDAFKGTQIDEAVKDIVKTDALNGHLIAAGVQASEPFQHALDFDNMTTAPNSAQWYDLTTPEGWAKHLATYYRWGNGQVLSNGEVITGRLVSWPTIQRALNLVRGGGGLGEGGGGGGGAE
jgi:hypothetical protein